MVNPISLSFIHLITQIMLGSLRNGSRTPYMKGYDRLRAHIYNRTNQPNIIFPLLSFPMSSSNLALVLVFLDLFLQL
jgi:hypothetical protein